MTSIDYTYEFHKEQLEEIKACKEQHGFAIVKNILEPALLHALQEEVRTLLAPRAQEETVRSFTHGYYIEEAPVFAGLLGYEPLMRIVRYLHEQKSITLNRSAAIYKKPGAVAGEQTSGAMAWHTDWGPLEHPFGANEILNNTGAFSCWFYLTGSQPTNGGLSIIPDSHTDDWEAPAGFEFTNRKKSFYRTGTENKPYCEMDVPGMMPVVTEPGDLVIFAEKTYHGVNPHRGKEVRLSCGLSFRETTDEKLDYWNVSDSAKKFIASTPDAYKPMVEQYVGIDTAWRALGK